jgi:peptide/nickel transport system permease protein
VTLVLGSLPSYWLAYLLILLFAVGLHLLPVAGWGTPQHLVLPALTLAVGVVASLSRLTRATMLEELEQTYVRTARAKGVTEGAVLRRHCLRNAGIPLATVAALRFGHLLAGAVIVETVFAWPGIGSFVVDAIYDRDFPVIQGFVLFTGTVFLAVNLLADLAYQRLDPRIRIGDGMERGRA